MPATKQKPSRPALSKRLLARAYDSFGLARLDALADWVSPNFIQGINYHHTPPAVAAGLDAQLRWLRERYEPVDSELLERFLKGEHTFRKPGVMIHFDDGFADHVEVALPILERHGFRGWFHLVTGRVDAASSGHASDEAPWERSMTWEQARLLVDRGHQVCSHTVDHVRMKSTLTSSVIQKEVEGSREQLKERLGVDPTAFCWPGGETDAYDARAAELVMRNYRYAFPSYSARIRPGTSPHALTRSNVEASWDLSVMRLSCSRLWELKHRSRARMYRSLVAGG